jgi:F0F1-type ATP synthase epsilon subunit
MSMLDPALYPTGPSTGQTDALATLNQLLNEYGLSGLASWAQQEILTSADPNGPSAAQLQVDLYAQPAFQQRFPGIFSRIKAGLPPISPTDYINYEDQALQLENQYGLPKGFLTDPTRIGNLIGGDTSMNELQARVVNGFSHVATAPQAVQASFNQMFGAYGPGALASHFLDTNTAQPILEQQATAADIAGQAGMLGINPSTADAMTLAQRGETGSSTESGMQQLAGEEGIFNANVGNANPLTAADQGVKAQFGLDQLSTEQVAQQQEALAATSKGGGGPNIDQYGTSAGQAKNF